MGHRCLAPEDRVRFPQINQQKALEVEQRLELTGPGDVNPDFGKATKFQDPLQVQLAARHTY